MFSKFFKRSEPKPAEPTVIIAEAEEAAPMVVADAVPTEVQAPAQTTPVAEPKLGFFARIKQGLSRTSSNFAQGLGNLILGRKTIDDDLFEELESQLLIADVGLDATTEIIDNLTKAVARKQLTDGDALYAALREQLALLLRPVEKPLVVENRVVEGVKKPYVILVVGVNGVGKTTTIGKLAKRLHNQGKKVILAAGDTFRAAAVEQLQVWGERNQVPVIAQHTGADSASVIYDALQAAQARGMDVLIADTAGRLHNKDHLMDELSKVKRVLAKLDAGAPDEVLLVLDAGTGQNAVNQAQQFIEAAGVTGLALTKLDGTAKGGVIFALSKKFGLPVRFIGVGEGIDDLQPFAAEPFIEALFSQATE
jgi:fused signal recognition particle receptor